MSDEVLKRIEERKAARRQAERSFDLLGETLTIRPSVVYEVGRDLEQARMDVATSLLKLQGLLVTNENTEEPELDDLLAATAHHTEVSDRAFDVAEETILDCLTPESHEAWARLRDKNAADPITFDEIFEIADYLLGRVAGVPTSAPADSSAGRTETASKSKGKSSSPAKHLTALTG